MEFYDHLTQQLKMCMMNYIELKKCEEGTRDFRQYGALNR
jgi:hypothetical protein